MTPLDRLERRFGRFAVPHVTEAWIFFQVFVYLIGKGQPELLPGMQLVPQLVLQGEAWRLVTFLVDTRGGNPICMFFFWYVFYLMGTSLEATWGAFRYNIFLLIGYLATVGVSFVTPLSPVSVGPFQGSVFLAFAFLYPNFQLMLFFLLPVKIKWLALLTWIYYFYILIFGGWQIKLAMVAAIANFLVFFGADVWRKMRLGRRRMATQAVRIKDHNKPRHVCRVCGKNNLTHPDMDFRYCSKCKDASCYCEEHLRDHDHVGADETAKG